LHQVAVLERAFIGGQCFAVNQGSVSTAQVAHDDRVTADGEFSVLATHLFTVWPQVTGLAAADLEIGPDQRDDLSLGLASHNNQLHFHENRPDR
jgi:hypothetical protein